MFAPEGWISLRDIYEYFVWYFSENEALGDFIFTGDECYELTWYFADEAKQLAVCTAEGEAVSASRLLVEVSNVFDHENRHINLYFGTVGSGDILQADSFPGGVFSLEQFLDLTYGSFRNLPVIFRYHDFEQYLCSLASDDEEPVSEDMSPKAVSKRIVDTWREDPTLIQADLKAIIAPDLSVRAFRFAWGLAVMAEPDLKRPGRRKRKS